MQQRKWKLRRRQGGAKEIREYSPARGTAGDGVLQLFQRTTGIAEGINDVKGHD